MHPLIILLLTLETSRVFTLQFFNDVHVDNKCKLISFSPSSYYVLSTSFGFKTILNGHLLRVEACVAE